MYNWFRILTSSLIPILVPSLSTLSFSPALRSSDMTTGHVLSVLLTPELVSRVRLSLWLSILQLLALIALLLDVQLYYFLLSLKSISKLKYNIVILHRMRSSIILPYLIIIYISVDTWCSFLSLPHRNSFLSLVVVGFLIRISNKYKRAQEGSDEV